GRRRGDRSDWRRYLRAAGLRAGRLRQRRAHGGSGADDSENARSVQPTVATLENDQRRIGCRGSKGNVQAGGNGSGGLVDRGRDRVGGDHAGSVTTTRGEWPGSRRRDPASEEVLG